MSGLARTSIVCVIVASFLDLPVFAQSDDERVTFSNQVVRILQQSCQRCHRPGQVAPMSLLSYDEVRPWAKSIRTAVMKRAMPPWHADPRYGTFINDPRLTDEAIDTIVKWVDAGAPEGDPSDLPPPLEFDDGWSIGEPDLILTMDRPYRVPARGRDQFEYFQIDTGLTEDRFVSAVEVMPGNRRVVHHVLAYVHQRDDYNFSEEASFEDSIGDGGTLLIEYGLGNKGDIFPPGSGRLLKRGSRIWMQVHYHSYGEAAEDRTSIGLKFYPKGGEYQRIISRWVGARSLSIPPRTKDVPSQGSYTFRRPVRIVSFQPHMHCRGQAMMARAVYPDGRAETLVSVPNFDFNWQTTYIFENPPLLPRGTRFEVYAMHDNTKENPNNPNPNAYVRWGQETTDEMMHGWTDFVYADEVVEGAAGSFESPLQSRSVQPVETASPVAEIEPVEVSSGEVSLPVSFAFEWENRQPPKARTPAWVFGLGSVMGMVLLVLVVRKFV